VRQWATYFISLKSACRQTGSTYLFAIITDRNAVPEPKLGYKAIAAMGYGQNGDKPKRLQVQSKRINLLSSTADPLRVLLTKFQSFQLCSFRSAVIS